LEQAALVKGYLTDEAIFVYFPFKQEEIYF